MWGWNPSTFAAVGTVSASVVAVIALLAALAQGHAQRHLEVRMRQEDRARESRLVRCSMQWRTRDAVIWYTVTLTNGMTRTIYPRIVEIAGLGGRGELMNRVVPGDLRYVGHRSHPTWPWIWILTREEDQVLTLDGLPPELAPEQSRTFEVGLKSVNSSRRIRRLANGTFYLTLAFEDGYGDHYSKGPLLLGNAPWSP